MIVDEIQEKINYSGLNEPQRQAVVHGEGPLLILAGAGSGKTRVITYRIAHLLECGVKPWNMLAVTFTNKAAAEMRERVTTLTRGMGSGVWISTFHSFCAQILRTEGPNYGIPKHFTIYDDDDQKKVVLECIRELKLDEKKMKPNLFVNRISREKDRLMDASSFTINASVSADPYQENLAAIYSLYEKKMQASGALDFGDLLMKTVELIHAHAPLREKYQERFQHLLVDEYQDTNRAQYVLTKTLAGKHKNICVVGDDDQAIYSWRGADVKNILDFERDYPAVKVIKLEQNYRSTQPILAAAWQLVKNNETRKEKKLWTERASSDPIEIHQARDEVSEARWVSDTVREFCDRGPTQFSDCAIFYRTNAQSRVLEDALRQQDIPYVLIGTVRFYERAEVKDLLAYLRLVANPDDNLSFKRIINTPARGIGKASVEMLAQYAQGRNCSLFEALFQADCLANFSSRAQISLMGFRDLITDWIKRKDDITISPTRRKSWQVGEWIHLYQSQWRRAQNAQPRPRQTRR